MSSAKAGCEKGAKNKSPNKTKDDNKEQLSVRKWESKSVMKTYAPFKIIWMSSCILFRIIIPNIL